MSSEKWKPKSVRYPYTPIWMAKVHNDDNTKCRQDCEATGTLIHYCWECKTVQTLWKNNKLCNILQEMGTPDHLTCLLRNLHAGQEAIVRTGPGSMDWFKIGKGMHQGSILSLCLFNLYAEYIMQNAWLDDSSWNQDCQEKYQLLQIRIWHHPNGREWRRTKEPLEVKEESEKAGLKLNIQKTKITASSRITS